MIPKTLSEVQTLAETASSRSDHAMNLVTEVQTQLQRMNWSSPEGQAQLQALIEEIEALKAQASAFSQFKAEVAAQFEKLNQQIAQLNGVTPEVAEKSEKSVKRTYREG